MGGRICLVLCSDHASEGSQVCSVTLLSNACAISRGQLLARVRASSVFLLARVRASGTVTSTCAC